MISDPKYNFWVGQKWFFVVLSKVSIFHRIQPSYVSKTIVHAAGTSYIPPQYQPHLKCIVEQEGVMSADDAPDTSYYQWVTFMFCIQVNMSDKTESENL